MGLHGRRRREGHYYGDYSYHSNPINELKDFNRTKRFVLVFQIWGATKDVKTTVTQYDTEAEWKEEARLLEEYYADTLRPKVKQKVLDDYKRRKVYYYERYTASSIHTYSPENTYDFDDGSKFWGYIVLDYEKCDIIKFGGDGIKYHYKENYKDYSRLAFLDATFRGKDEIPKGYVWDTGEYKGWLRFRWGDGKNAVDYRPPKKCGLHTCGETYDDKEESALDKLEEDFQKADNKEWIITRLDRW